MKFALFDPQQKSRCPQWFQFAPLTTTAQQTVESIFAGHALRISPSSVMSTENTARLDGSRNAYRMIQRIAHAAA
jgi:hypothetical protein